MPHCLYTEGGVVCGEPLFNEHNPKKGLHPRHEHKHKGEDCEVNSHLHSYNFKNETFTETTSRERLYCHAYKKEEQTP